VAPGHGGAGGEVGGRTAVLRFHYAERARSFADEKRAHAAHERMAGAYEVLAEKLEAEGRALRGARAQPGGRSRG
jgi:hypothetical protein